MSKEIIGIVEVRQRNGNKMPIPIAEMRIVDRATLEVVEKYSTYEPPFISKTSQVPATGYTFYLN